jgi:hypothetical protein
MEREFVPYELSVKLKVLGFDEPCFGYYINESKELMVTSEKDINYLTGTSNKTFISSPLYQQAFRWFREKYQLFGGILSEYSYGGQIHAYHITGKHQGDISKGDFNTYEEAELAALTRLIEIVESKSE